VKEGKEMLYAKEMLCSSCAWARISGPASGTSERTVQEIHYTVRLESLILKQSGYAFW